MATPLLISDPNLSYTPDLGANYSEEPSKPDSAPLCPDTRDRYVGEVLTSSVIAGTSSFFKMASFTGIGCNASPGKQVAPPADAGENQFPQNKTSVYIEGVEVSVTGDQITIEEGQALNIFLEMTDPEKDIFSSTGLVWNEDEGVPPSIQNDPTSASIHASYSDQYPYDPGRELENTGLPRMYAISWTPQVGDAGTYKLDAEFTEKDAFAIPFKITVTPAPAQIPEGIDSEDATSTDAGIADAVVAADAEVPTPDAQPSLPQKPHLYFSQDRYGVSEAQEIRIPVTCRAEENQECNISVLPADLARTGAVFENGVLSWTPPYGFGGQEYTFTFNVSDSLQQEGNPNPEAIDDSQTIRITVLDNRLPVFIDKDGRPTNHLETLPVTAGESVQVDLRAVDPDNEPVSYSWDADSLPVSSNVVPIEGGIRFTWNTDSSDFNNDPYVFRFFVNDRENRRNPIDVTIPLLQETVDGDGDGFQAPAGQEPRAFSVAPNGQPWDCDDENPRARPFNGGSIHDDITICPTEDGTIGPIIVSPNQRPVTIEPYGEGRLTILSHGDNQPGILIQGSANISNFDGVGFSHEGFEVPFVKVENVEGPVNLNGLSSSLSGVALYVSGSTQVRAQNFSSLSDEKGFSLGNSPNAFVEMTMDQVTNAFEVNGSDEARLIVDAGFLSRGGTVTDSDHVSIQGNIIDSSDEVGFVDNLALDIRDSDRFVFNDLDLIGGLRLVRDNQGLSNHLTVSGALYAATFVDTTNCRFNDTTFMLNNVAVRFASCLLHDDSNVFANTQYLANLYMAEAPDNGRCDAQMVSMGLLW